MMRVTEQLNSLELMCKEMEKKLKGEQQEGHGVDERIDKLPSFHLFSGTEPTPKDEYVSLRLRLQLFSRF